MLYKDFPSPHSYIGWAKANIRTHGLSNIGLTAIWQFYRTYAPQESCGIGLTDPPWATCDHPLNDPLSEWAEYKSALDAVLEYEIFPHHALHITEEEYMSYPKDMLEMYARAYWQGITILLYTGVSTLIYLPS